MATHKENYVATYLTICIAANIMENPNKIRWEPVSIEPMVQLEPNYIILSFYENTMIHNK